MGAFYDDPEKNVRATDCIVLSVSEGKGAAHGKKCVARVKYKLRDQEITEYVNFWNNSGAKHLDLCDRLHKCASGDTILLLFHPSKPDKDGRTVNGDCIDFAREGYPLWVSGMTVIMGKANALEKTASNMTACALEIPGHDEVTQYKYCFWGSLNQLGISNDQKKLVVCLGNEPVDQLTKDGMPIRSFNGFKAYTIEEMDTNFIDELMITIGVFRNHPIPLSKLLDVTEKELPGRLSWCHYVADEWMPNEKDQNLINQKEAIRKLIA